MSGRGATLRRSRRAAVAIGWLRGALGWLPGASAWIRRALAWLRGALADVASLRPGAVRRALAAAPARISPRGRRWLLVALGASLVLFGGYRFWLRDSSLVAVERVTITGLTTSDAQRVRVALTSAARTMTTLHVDREALDRVVEGYPAVRALEVTTDFPHGLRVRVIEHHPAAIAVSDAGRVPVAADGTILRGIPVEGRLPTVPVDGQLGDERLEDRDARAAVAVAGAAPPVLRPRIDEIRRDSDDGLVATLRDGPDLIFGNARRLRAKWAAAARVLADLEARGASYVDLRIPGRPAAGGLASQTVTPVAPAGTTNALPPVADSGAAGATAAGTQPTGTTDPMATGAPTGTADATGNPTGTADPTATGEPTGTTGATGTTDTPPQPTAPTITPTAPAPTQSGAPAEGTAQGGAAVPGQP